MNRYAIHQPIHRDIPFNVGDRVVFTKKHASDDKKLTALRGEITGMSPQTDFNAWIHVKWGDGIGSTELTLNLRHE